MNKLDGKLEIGIRPEFIHFDNEKTGLPVEITKVSDLGRYKIIEAQHKQHTIKMVAYEDVAIPSESPNIFFAPDKQGCTPMAG